MINYEYLEHTADAKFKAYGKTDEIKFQNAALAMFNIITDTKKVKNNKEYNINLSANSLRGLIYDFLDELLFYHETEDFILKEIKNLKIENKNNKHNLTCIAQGDNSKDYEFIGHIKAITYNDFEYTDDYVVMVMDL